jgi:hypothetical protein
MRLVSRLLIAALVIAGFFAVSRADDAGASADPVRERLATAKAVNTKAKQQAGDTLRAGFESAIKSASSGKQSDLVTQLKSQEQAFTATGALPAAAEMKQAVSDYHEAIELSDATLDRAYARAIRHYAAQGDGTTALALEQEKSRLSQQRTAIAATPASQESATGTTADALMQGKARYRTTVNDAMKTMLAKVDSRLNIVINAGELQPARELQAIETSLKTSGRIPENITDAEVMSAAANYRHAIQIANVQMARAYSAAVRQLTQKRQLDQAQAVQTEFVTSELSTIDLTAIAGDGASPADTTYVLGRNLPEFLTTGEHWDLHPRGGIFLQRRSFIRSKNGDFLNRDFTCDFWFTTETTGTNIFIGLGDGRGRPTDLVPANSLALCISSPDANEGAVGFLRPDGQIDTIGQLSSAGDYVARIERAGNVLSMSIGDEDADGTFNAKFSTTLSDTTVMAPFITNHNAHIFFGGGRFWKIRFINGKPPAVIPDGVVKSLVGGN